MKHLMPLKRVVVEVTHEALADDEQGIRKAIKCWYNRLSAGSIPRDVIMKLGRGLFLDLDAWEEWLASRSTVVKGPRRGRPRAGE